MGFRYWWVKEVIVSSLWHFLLKNYKWNEGTNVPFRNFWVKWIWLGLGHYAWHPHRKIFYLFIFFLSFLSLQEWPRNNIWNRTAEPQNQSHQLSELGTCGIFSYIGCFQFKTTSAQLWKWPFMVWKYASMVLHMVFGQGLIKQPASSKKWLIEKDKSRTFIELYSWKTTSA